MNKLPERITRNWIDGTENVELLEECAFDLAIRAHDMLASSRHYEATIESPAFESIELRWNLIAVKLGWTDSLLDRVH